MYSVMTKSMAGFLAVWCGVSLLLPAQAADCNSTKRTPERTDFTSVVREMFKRLDSNHDGSISAAEIDAEVSDHNLGKEEASALATLKLTEIAGKDSVVFTKGMLDAYEHAVETNVKPSSDYDKTYQDCKQKLYKSRKQLVFAGLKHLSEAHKGNICECPLFSLAVALNGHSHEQLSKMVSKVGHSTYRIATPGKPAVTLTVPSRAEIAIDPRSSTKEYWEQRLESTCNQLKPAVSPTNVPLANLLSSMAVFELIPQLAEHAPAAPKVESIVGMAAGKDSRLDNVLKLVASLR